MDRIRILSQHLGQFKNVEQVSDAGIVQSGTSAHLPGKSGPVLIGGMVMDVQVDYYGAPTPLRQLAGISVPESTLLVVQPYDKGAMQVQLSALKTINPKEPAENLTRWRFKGIVSHGLSLSWRLTLGFPHKPFMKRTLLVCCLSGRGRWRGSLQTL